MSEFKTVGPTRFGVGDGSTRKFSVGRPGDVVQSTNIESVRKVGWQGDVLLSPRPRTNLVLFSNDFANTAWKGSPSLYADFTTGNMPTGFDFSRASTATYWDADGILREAGVDEPRFDHDPVTGEALGLLRERAATNLNLYSDYSNTSTWTGSEGVVEVDVILGAKATKFSGENIRRRASVGRASEDAGFKSTISFLLRSVVHNEPLKIEFASGTGSNAGALPIFIDFDNQEVSYTLGTATADMAINSLTPTWLSSDTVRIVATIENGSQRTFGALWVTNRSFSGDFSLGAVQHETGSVATSYIPTEGTAATRAVDVITYAKADNSPLFPNGEFSCVIDYDATALTPSADRITAYFNGTTPLSVKDANTLDGYGNALPSLGYHAGRNKVSFAVNANRKSGSCNGGTTVESLVATTGVNSTTQVNFSQGGVAQNYNGHLRSFQLYNRALPDTTLQELSSL